MRRRWMLRSLLVPALSLVTQVSRADDPQPARYTVKAGDTCSTIAASFFGDVKRIDLVHVLNPQLGPVPHHLRAGQVLLLPAKPTREVKGPDAKLTRVRNRVEVRAPDPHVGKVDDPLWRGNRVGTQGASAADLTFRDETQVRLGENTLVVIFGDTNAAASRTTAAEATLVSGSLRARLSEIAGQKADKPKVATESGAVVIKSGEAQVSVDAQKATRLAVYSGGSTVTAQKKTVPVDDGFGSKAELGKVPTPPRPLPAAPVWSALPSTLVLTEAESGEVTGTYGPGQGPGDPAAEWHVQIARDVAFDEVAVDVRVPLATTALTAQQMAPGSYAVRVSAIDGDAFEGKWGSVATVVVARLALTPLPGRRTRVASSDPALACGIDGGPAIPFPFEVDRAGGHALSCTSGSAIAAFALAQLPAEAAPAIAPPVEPHVKNAMPPPPPKRFEVALGGAGVARGSTQLGFGGFVSFAVVAPVGPGSAFVALRGFAEHYPETATAAKSRDDVIADTRASVTVLGASLPIGYRVGTGSVVPYLLLAPQVAHQVVAPSSGDSAGSVTVGAYGAFGLDRRTGPGALFLEAGFRAAAVLGSERPSVPGSSALLGIGYRLGL